MSREVIIYGNELYHHGIKGQKWGIRRYQNSDGSLTEEGKRRYNGPEGKKNLQLDLAETHDRHEINKLKRLGALALVGGVAGAAGGAVAIGSAAAGAYLGVYGGMAVSAFSSIVSDFKYTEKNRKALRDVSSKTLTEIGVNVYGADPGARDGFNNRQR